MNKGFLNNSYITVSHMLVMLEFVIRVMWYDHMPWRSCLHTDFNVINYFRLNVLFNYMLRLK